MVGQTATGTAASEKYGLPVMAVVAVLLLTLGAVIVWLLLDDKHLSFTEVKISGELDYVQPHELVQIINRDVKGNFFTLNVGRLYEDLVSLEWVGQVWIHRVWPDMLNIQIVEQEPIAIVEGKGLLNARGEIFTARVPKTLVGLPHFIVTERYYQQAISAYQTLSRELPKHDLAIKTFIFDERKSQTVVLNNDVRVVIGRINAQQRFSRFLEAFAHHMQNNGSIRRVDLRYTNGFAVGMWRFSDLMASNKEALA